MCLKLFLVLFAFLANASEYSVLPPHEDSDAYFEDRQETIDHGPGDTRALNNADFQAGFLTHTFGTMLAGRASFIQTDGKIVVGGRTIVSDVSDWAIVRFHPDGNVDTSFGSGGMTITSFGSRINQNDVIHALSLQTDAKIVAVGLVNPGDAGYGRFGIARYLTDGVLDTSFFTSGKTYYSLANRTVVIPRGIAMDTAAQFAVTGYSWNGAQYDGMTGRFTTDGRLDTAFSTDGYVVESMAAGDDGFMAIILQTDGNVVVGGHAKGGDWDYALARYLTSGEIDTSFATDGTLVQPALASDDRLFALTQDTTSGAIYGGGSAYNGDDYDFSLVKVTVTGAIDTSFSTNGKLETSFGTGEDSVTGLGLQTDGKIYASGYFKPDGSLDLVLTRFQTDGGLDTSFKTNGKSTTAMSNRDDFGMSFSMMGDGYLIQAGRRSVSATVVGLIVARYQTNGDLAASGDPDLSFGTVGTKQVTLQASESHGYSIVELPDKKILATGTTDGVGGFNPNIMLVRLNLNGSLDTSFHTDGMEWKDYALGGGDYDYIYETAVDTLGRYVNAGAVMDPSLAYAEALMLNRYLTSGNLDTTFHTDGTMLHNLIWQWDYFYAMDVWTDGKILASGRYGNNSSGWIERYESDGSFDTSFLTTGSVQPPTSTYINCQNVEPNGLITFAGMSGSGATAKFAVYRYLTSGAIDTTFHTDGYNVQTIPDANTIFTTNRCGLVFSNGTYWGTATAINTASGEYRPASFRFCSDGAVDTSFNTAGFVHTSHQYYQYGGTKAGNGKYLVVGDSASGATSDFIVERFQTNGVVDTTFGTNGISYTNFSNRDIGESIVIRQDGRICLAGSAASIVKLGVTCLWP